MYTYCMFKLKVRLPGLRSCPRHLPRSCMLSLLSAFNRKLFAIALALLQVSHSWILTAKVSRVTVHSKVTRLRESSSDFQDPYMHYKIINILYECIVASTKAQRARLM